MTRRLQTLLPIALVASLLAWRGGDHSWAETWVERWGLLACLIPVIFIWRMPFRHWAFPLLLTYMIGLAVLRAYMPWIFPVYLIFDQGTEATDSLVGLVARGARDHLAMTLTFLAFLASGLTLRRLWPTVSVLVTLGLLFAHPGKSDSWVPILDNPTMR